MFTIRPKRHVLLLQTYTAELSCREFGIYSIKTSPRGLVLVQPDICSG